MENIQTISDIAKETLTFLAFCDNDIIKKIPNNVIEKLCEEAADSTTDFYIDPSKNFKDQEITEKSKDLIASIYFNYIADEVGKKEIQNKWILNDKNYENSQKEKYNPDKLFENVPKQEIQFHEQYPAQAMIGYKENFFMKIINKIKNIFKA